MRRLLMIFALLAFAGSVSLAGAQGLPQDADVLVVDEDGTIVGVAARGSDGTLELSLVEGRDGPAHLMVVPPRGEIVLIEVMLWPDGSVTTLDGTPFAELFDGDVRVVGVAAPELPAQAPDVAREARGGRDDAGPPDPPGRPDEPGTRGPRQDVPRADPR